MSGPSCAHVSLALGLLTRVMGLTVTGLTRTEGSYSLMPPRAQRSVQASVFAGVDRTALQTRTQPLVGRLRPAGISPTRSEQRSAQTAPDAPKCCNRPGDRGASGRSTARETGTCCPVQMSAGRTPAREVSEA